MERRRKSLDPFEFVTDLRSEIDRMVSEMFYRSGLTRPSYFEPYVDIQETLTEVLVTAELPGIKKKDIKLNVTEDMLEISAEAREEVAEERPGLVRKERRIGKFYRSLSLPCKVKPEEAKAKYVDGVLEVRLPRMEVRRGRDVEVE
jgi:HSP20 family protein